MVNSKIPGTPRTPSSVYLGAEPSPFESTLSGVNSSCAFNCNCYYCFQICRIESLPGICNIHKISRTFTIIRTSRESSWRQQMIGSRDTNRCEERCANYGISKFFPSTKYICFNLSNVIFKQVLKRLLIIETFWNWLFLWSTFQLYTYNN